MADCTSEVISRTDLNRDRHRWPCQMSSVLELAPFDILGQSHGDFKKISSRVDSRDHLSVDRKSDVDSLDVNVAPKFVDEQVADLLVMLLRLLRESSSKRRCFRNHSPILTDGAARLGPLLPALPRGRRNGHRQALTCLSSDSDRYRESER